MHVIFGLLRKKWAHSLGVVIAVCIFIWYMGPYIAIADHAPLRPQLNRIAGMAFTFLVWGLLTGYRRWKSRKTNENLLNSIASDDDEDVTEAKAAEAEALQDKMQDAIEVLKNKNFSKSGGNRYLYELPWYMIIGPPGAGKTTLLTNSGLNFPLEETHGKFSVKGVGGTRNCDWWFTDKAVLLDTAGRYTTQDSNREVDKNAWSTFLQQLKDNRKRRPINGMFIAVALHDIVNQSEDQLIQLAKTIRFRIDEIHETFSIRPTIYMVLTKCDMLAGFEEFFNAMDSDERKQVWGFTANVDDDTPFAETAKAELQLLRERLYAQLPAKLANETAQARRDEIYAFPMQFAAIQEKLQRFIEQFSSVNRLQDNVYLRGVYFTSATQDGSALDQVAASVARSFGFPSTSTPRLQNTGKSFFITKLLTDVVFAEHGLTGTNLAHEKRAKHVQLGAIAAIVLAAVAIVALLATSYRQNNTLMDGVVAGAGELEQNLEQLPSDSLDLIQVSAMLTKAQSLDTRETDEGFALKRTGLYQGNKIGSRAGRKYDELLTESLLSRLMVRLEHQMHAESDNSEFIFEALKTYQMLDSEEHYNAEDTIGWFRFDFDQNLPRTLPAADKRALLEHTENLLRDRPRRLPRPLDRELIDQYQQIAANTPLEERAYHRLKQQHAAIVNTPVTLTNEVGNDLARALVLTGDKTFNTAVPEFFTTKEYQSSFLPSVALVSGTLSKDVWVLGPYAGNVVASDAAELENSVTDQYYREYIDVWQSLLDSLTFRKSSGLLELSDFLSLITDNESPFKKLLVVAAEQTTLSLPSTDSEAATDEKGDSRQAGLAALIGSRSNGNSAEIDDPVTSHFSALHTLVEDWESNGSRLDNVLQKLGDLNLQLLPMATTPGAAGDVRLANELAVKIRQLSTTSERLPASIARVVDSLTNDVNDASSGGFCAQLNSLWEAEVYPFYARALANRYPLSKRATNEITLEDFGKFFGPGGILDTYVGNYLSSSVQRRPGKWEWVGSGNSQCISDNTLRQLAIADEIKQTYFTQGSTTPSFSFSLNPSRLVVDQSIYKLFMTIGNVKTEYLHAPIQGGTSYVWPGNSGSTEASIRVEPVIAGTLSRISLNGPWGILRLLESGNVKRKNSSDVAVDFSFGGRPVHMEFTSSSFNPLRSRSLRQFRCPRSL